MNILKCFLYKFFEFFSQKLLGHGLKGIKFCGGVSRGSRDIIKNVVVCSGILHVLLQYGDCTSLIATPNKVISWTLKIFNYSATGISDDLYSKTTF